MEGRGVELECDFKSDHWTRATWLKSRLQMGVYYLAMKEMAIRSFVGHTVAIQELTSCLTYLTPSCLST